ncbi:hydroxyethylthiazole kinase [Cereibacter azotoformans]|uniref:Hydroxyethylthiazole kinase n=1 Tax=Cereibacter azotoformans TaxID=43057 RepID=A0A2T5JN94_9RHOB|nr:hydroxyethylthiazole kinase [Cereibacter azotoformans]AXQ92807.1 hydroxyethylthiazole kinase [Cereibacter sphaeroides]MBO4169577.1 hydroxyethylthiazole kinase [Cereibacter azotoformans]PTR08735.1 hydroxyethylthiazole kinase [Cereibacter azotoformans]UIJ31091.1 hydroxyethylthiazole kinase [Cereibacter azotoformans]
MDRCGAYLDTMRSTAPLVQCITNFVAMNVMANVLLAAGASPAMVHDAEESGEFAAIAQVLTINLGTPSPRWVEGMEAAARGAVAAGRPWVLDPVAVGATAFRRGLGARLLALKPTVIRGNASEILALAGAEARGKGADSADTVAAAEAAAQRLAEGSGAVVAVTGPVDFVTDGRRGIRCGNGHALMPKVTALGCSLTGIVGAFAAGGPAFEATAAGLAFFGLAGEEAARRAAGPGSFQVAFLDALHAMTPDDLDRGAKLEAA